MSAQAPSGENGQLGPTPKNRSSKKRNIIIAVAVILSIATAAMAAPADNAINGTKEWEELSQLRASGSIPVNVYRSTRSGLHVVVAQVEGPLVKGYFVLGTEESSDDGLPHTLEHLVFLGSEDYPYKGVLDLLANRCFASGTNAWTDVDHTAYTVQNAGTEGFLNLLPIYLDHLLYPTLTEAGFITEVYHITGEGEDAGVVYAEMQGRENSDSDRTVRELLRAGFPEPSGYRYETGGIMSNLRDSTNSTKIRNFHKKFYRPENLWLVITGQISPDSIFEALEPFERKILSKGDRGPYTRPWQSEVPEVTSAVEKLVLYPSDREDNGLVLVGWRGPSSVEELDLLFSLNILMDYMTQSAVSPLPQAFVEVDDPFASDVSATCYETSSSLCYFKFSGVPTTKLSEVAEHLRQVLNELSHIDMAVMRDLLSNKILRQDSNLETSPHSTIAGEVISYMILGRSENDLDKRLMKKKWYAQLLEEPESYWLNLLKVYLIDTPMIVINGMPSIEEAERLKNDEKERVARRKEELGKEGLQKLEDKLKEAKRINEIPPPPSMLKSVPVPGVQSLADVRFHKLEAYHNHARRSESSLSKQDLKKIAESANVKVAGQESPKNFDIESIPFSFHVDDVNGDFVTFMAILDTHNLTEAQRPYLTLLLNLVWELPVMRGDTLIPYEEIVKEISAIAVSHTYSLGLDFFGRNFDCGPYCSNALFYLKVERSKYNQGVELLSELLYKTVCTAERVSVVAKKLLNSVAASKREGTTILNVMFNDVLYKEDTNRNQVGVLRQEAFLKKMLKRLEDDAEQVLQEIEDVRCLITRPENVLVHMASNLAKLTSTVVDPAKPWITFVKSYSSNEGDDLKKEQIDKSLNVIAEHQLKREDSPDEGNVTGYMTSVAASESAYLLQVLPRSIMKHTDEDLPTLLTAMQYFTQLEGPMWKGIRGRGLAYGYSLILNPTAGVLSFKLYRSAQLLEAYEAATNILKKHLETDQPWDPLLLDSARSSLIYEIIEREATVLDVTQQSVLSYFRGVDTMYNKALLSKISAVSMEDVRRVSAQYLKPLLDLNKAKTLVVISPGKLEEAAESFKKFGHNLEVVPDVENSRFSQ